MPKIAQWNYVGPRSTPHDVRQIRKQSFDYHRKLGQPIIHKHKWNLRDVKDGRARLCPFHDVDYESDAQWDPYCFGTGILGGYADGVITFITIADAQQDTIRITPEGQLLMETHPAFTAPWVPQLGDGDLIITARFAPDTWDVLEEDERYVLREVTPRVQRGFRDVRTGYRIHQEGQMDKIPLSDNLYQVPIVFDYNKVPDDPVVPPGGDPDDYPIPGTRRSHTEFAVRTGGGESGVSSSTERVGNVRGLGASISTERGVKMNVDPGGSTVIFEEEF